MCYTLRGGSLALCGLACFCEMAKRGKLFGDAMEMMT